MAYDGLFIKAQINEIKSIILDEHISKITQKSLKEISFHIRKNNQNLTLTLSANPNFPHILLSRNSIENLNVPPAFCMLLRKYLQGALIKNIYQIGKWSTNNIDILQCLERIIKFEFENINENGDICTYFLYIEVMGKYSNVVITDSDNIILDVLIKGNIENPRLMPKIKYSNIEVANKSEILSEAFDNFIKKINEEKSLSSLNNEKFDLSSVISNKYAGLSKQFVMHEILDFILINYDKASNNFNYETINKYISDDKTYEMFFDKLKNDISTILSSNTHKPTINYKNDKPSDFYLFKLNNYEGTIKTFDSTNECLEEFINEKYKELNDSSEQKNLELIVKNLYIKLNKKLDIYKKDLAKCDDLEKYKTYGELVSAFGYSNEKIKDGILTCEDYNNNNDIVNIPIDETKSISQNVEKYYDKYNKLKRTKENAEKLIEETIEKIEHLNSISNSLSLPNDKNDLYLIKEELFNYFDEANKVQGLNKHKADIRSRKNVKNSKNKLNYNIHHYKSSSGIDIYVGKNNLQNEYLTFTLANPDDTWLHIKNGTGSHVIIKKPYESLDDKSLIEAASLAAYFSEKKNETKATVDYTLRKELKKVKGKSPGFCIYHKNFSINVKPEILVKEIN